MRRVAPPQYIKPRRGFKGTDSHASDIGHWLGMTVLTRAAALGWKYPGTAVKGKAPTVATGSGSEAVAESCGGTVLLTDAGTRERRLREEKRNKFVTGVAR